MYRLLEGVADELSAASEDNRAWPLTVHQPLPPSIQQPVDGSAQHPAMQSAMQPPSNEHAVWPRDMHVALYLYNTGFTSVVQRLG